jgi:pyruvate dehydrogenase E1 component alpha subunit
MAAAKLATMGVAEAEIEQARNAAQAEVAAAVAAATAAPVPETALAYTDIQDTGAGRWH